MSKLQGCWGVVHDYSHFPRKAQFLWRHKTADRFYSLGGWRINVPVTVERDATLAEVASFKAEGRHAP